MKIKIEDIAFWLIIVLIIALALWMLSGSPTDTSAIVALAAFVAASEIFLWKHLFSIDKKTAIGFEKVKNHMNIKFEKINNQINETHKQLNEIKNLIKK